MEIKNGDNYIIPIVSVYGELHNSYPYVSVKVDNFTFNVPRTLLRQYRKVLGMLGNKGLEAQVGMKVWCEPYGNGELVEIARNHCPIRINWENGFWDYYTFNGEPASGITGNRFIYVTALPVFPEAEMLGMLGDKDLEARIGMKVWAKGMGFGEITNIGTDTYAVRVDWEYQQCFYFYRLDGSREGVRSIYVMELPPEPKGWAWFRNPLAGDKPYTHCQEVTMAEARVVENKRGHKLVHWTPKS